MKIKSYIFIYSDALIFYKKEKERKRKNILYNTILINEINVISFIIDLYLNIVKAYKEREKKRKYI